MADKKLFKNSQEISVKNQYTNENTNDDVYEIKNKNSKLLNSYTFNFLHDVYQKNTTKNYIKSLYTYLEHFGYKHLHFFGWKNCVIDDIIDTNTLFLQDNFGEFTNTIGNEHPDKDGHLNWSEHLYQKIKENNYI
jgi:hypothetical protein